VLLWVLLIAPQRRRQQAQRQLFEELVVGDEVLTAGGLYGTVREVADDRLLLEIAPGTTVRLDRRAIAGIVEDEAADVAVVDDDAGAEEPEPSPEEAAGRHEEPVQAPRT
jgi:preprotein translocase subunit YajC